MFCEQVLQVRLFNRSDMVIDLLDKDRIVVDTNHFIALGRQNGDNR